VTARVVDDRNQEVAFAEATVRIKKVAVACAALPEGDPDADCSQELLCLGLLIHLSSFFQREGRILIRRLVKGDLTFAELRNFATTTRPQLTGPAVYWQVKEIREDEMVVHAKP